MFLVMELLLPAIVITAALMLVSAIVSSVVVVHADTSRFSSFLLDPASMWITPAVAFLIALGRLVWRVRRGQWLKLGALLAVGILIVWAAFDLSRPDIRCKSKGGLWHQTMNYCIPPDCRYRGNCGEQASPRAQCQSLPADASLDLIYFMLGNPVTAQNGTYIWPAGKGESGRVVVLVRQDGFVLDVQCTAEQ